MRFISMMAVLLSGSLLAHSMAVPSCSPKRMEKMACCADASTEMDCCHSKAPACPVIKSAPSDPVSLAAQKWVLPLTLVSQLLSTLQKPASCLFVSIDVQQQPSGQPVHQASPPLRAPPALLA